MCEGFVGLSLCGVDYSADDLLHAVPRPHPPLHLISPPSLLHPRPHLHLLRLLHDHQRPPPATRRRRAAPSRSQVRTQLAHGAASCEVMVHPGAKEPQDGTAPVWDDFGASAARQHELSTLCSGALRSRMRRLVTLQPHDAHSRY